MSSVPRTGQPPLEHQAYAEGYRHLIDVANQATLSTVNRVIPISEIYGPVIQGEGQMIGVPTVFVRAGGCDYRCSWCDSLYAVDPQYKDTWRKMDADEILAEVRRLSGDHPLAITLSGGNPALYDWGYFLDLAHEEGYTVAIETQGSRPKDWMRKLDYLTISPKPPSSGMTTNHALLERTVQLGVDARLTETSLKIVCFDEADYAYAKDIHHRYPTVPCYLQVGNDAPAQGQDPRPEDLLAKLSWLWERVLEDRLYGVRPLPQLHTLIHGNARGT